MPRKNNPDSGRGDKVMQVYMKLAFTGRWWDQTDLAERIGCTGPTIKNVIDDLQRAGCAVETEKKAGRIRYRMNCRLPKNPVLITADEFQSLEATVAAAHNLPREDTAAARKALDKAEQLLHRSDDDGDGLRARRSYCEVFSPGTIDNKQFEPIRRQLARAIDDRRVCRVLYQKSEAPAPELKLIKPLKMFFAQGAIYVSVAYASENGRKAEPGFRAFALQRFRAVELTGRTFRFPPDYDFAKETASFGLIAGKPLHVEVEVKGWAATFASERIWSTNQRVRKSFGGVIIEFDTVSIVETVSALMQFGNNCRVLGPDELIQAMKERAREVLSVYDE